MRRRALCAHVAAEHPECVAGLVLSGAFGRLLRTDEYPWGWPPELYERFLASVEQVWLTRRRAGGDTKPVLAAVRQFLGQLRATDAQAGLVAQNR